MGFPLLSVDLGPSGSSLGEKGDAAQLSRAQPRECPVAVTVCSVSMT